MTNLVTVDELKGVLARQHQKALNNFFQGDEKKTLKFLSAVAYCVQTTPKLLECSQESTISAFMKCAEYNLFPSSVSGEVYILPSFNKGKMEAQFQLGYRGIISLLYGAGVKSIYTDIVKKNDYFKVSGGLNPNIEHEYALGNRGEASGVYVVAIINNEKIWKYMSRDEVLEFKKFSKSGSSEYSPWNPKNDPELNMWRKTAIKQVSKNLSLTENAYSAIAADNEESSIEDYQKQSMVDHAIRESTSLEELLTPSPINKEVKVDTIDTNTKLYVQIP